MSERIPLTPEEREAAKIFANARGFQIAAVTLNAQEGPIKKFVFWPMVVNEVFSLELFIKARLALHGIKVPAGHDGHDLQKLYESIPEDDKKQIALLFEEIVQGHPDYQWAVENGCSFEVIEVLKRNRETFKRVRYWHEGKPLTTDSSGNTGSPGVGNLSDAIWHLFLRYYPSWNDENLSRAITLPPMNRPPT